MSPPEIPHHFPRFLWKFWLFGAKTQMLGESRVHVYDVYDNELSEARQIPQHTRAVFRDFLSQTLDSETTAILSDVEQVFSRLESEAENTLAELISRTRSSGKVQKKVAPIDRKAAEDLRKYFVFLRFRNSGKYQEIIHSLSDNARNASGHVLLPTRFSEVRRRAVLGGILAFLQHTTSDAFLRAYHRPHLPAHRIDVFQNAMEIYCWRLCDADVCIGVASDDQEFILPECCFGTLDEGFYEDPECCDFFFPIIPTLALYVLGNAGRETPPVSTITSKSSTTCLEIGTESVSDIHLRNAMILQTYPHRLYFSSLRSIALSVSSYEEFRWIQEQQDYSRLKQRCRQKFLQETVTKTLVIKGSVIITDLTDEVSRMGDSPICHGSFSDVWQGNWYDPIEKRTRLVALKYLRPVMVQNVREKLLKRLQAEVVVWHRLCHRNVSQLFGIVQSASSIGMVSPWCEHGTVYHYLRQKPSANRLRLLIQIASGIAYLHNFQPVIIHGDLKAGNILIDAHEYAIITDFGLSKVMEDVADGITIGTSFFAGSTRWMAPELIQTLVEDDGRVPPITTFSDVYAFASVCLEIATGQLPYAHRSNDHAVIVDILRGVKPLSKDATCLLGLADEGAFWAMLDQCWDEAYSLRPTMLVLLGLLESLVPTL